MTDIICEAGLGSLFNLLVLVERETRDLVDRPQPRQFIVTNPAFDTDELVELEECSWALWPDETQVLMDGTESGRQELLGRRAIYSGLERFVEAYVKRDGIRPSIDEPK